MDSRLLALLIAAAIALLAWASAPDLRPYAAQMVAAEGVALYPGSVPGLIVPVSEGEAQLADPALRDAVLRQLHFDIAPSEGMAFYLPALPAEADLHTNGMVGGPSEAAPFHGAGFGPQRLLVEIPASRLSFDQNRIDLYALGGWNAARLPVIHALPATNAPAFTVMIAGLEQRLRQGALGFGALGLALGLIGTAFLRSRWLFAGGVLLSLAVLDGAFGTVPAAWRLVVAAAGIAMLLWQGGWRRPVLAGATLAAGLGLLASAAILAGWRADLPLAWAANVALWPLAGIAVPLLALSEAQAAWREFITARATIRAQQALIAQQQGELEDSIRTQAVGEERQRFVRDMHDGVGGQLLSLLMRVRADDADGDEVAAELEKGLADLRLMADSLDHVGQDLDLALAAFHRRAGQQLAAAGLAFDWDKPDGLGQFHLDARAVLNLFRIMQEALTNCIRHAQATRFGVSFALAEEGKRLDVVIADDGVGFAPDVLDGRGLANIRKRAEKLGGTVAFGGGDGGKGSRIELRVPAG